MTLNMFLAVFLTVFVAELGDKTQLATLMFSADGSFDRLLVFLAALSALAASTALAVLGGGLLERFLTPRQVEFAGGVLFLLVGAWMLLRALQVIGAGR